MANSAFQIPATPSPLPVANGGSGSSTLASNGVLYGNGTSAIQALAVNSTATPKCLTQVSSGAPAWVAIGDYVDSNDTATKNFPTTETWSYNHSITLTAGDWDISAVIEPVSASTVAVCYMGISEAGTMSTGIHRTRCWTGAGYEGGASVPTVRVTVASSATYRLYVLAVYSTGTPTYAGRISATRVR